jgi:hypothetical protein
MQSVSSLQVVLQAVLEPQTYWPQVPDAGVVQVPEPEQCDAGVKVAPLQVAPGAQATLLAACVQAPEPLQLPVLPHGGLAAQRPCGSARPPVTLAQIPVPLTVHAWQVPQAAVEQQTPSTQLPLVHSWPVPQVVPLPLTGRQLPPAAVQ